MNTIMDERPIGMFDSGCGGLTVLKEYLKEMPNEDFIYYGDTSHLPYGDKSKEKIIEYAKHIVNFLIQQNVKMIVIACGTASALSYEELKSTYSLPIQNIITPTALNIQDKTIGVIATKGTIHSKAWENEIQKYHPDANIISVACPLFVPIVEEGFASTEISKLVIQQYLSAFQGTNITSLILGCTHYPILENQIQEVIGKNVNLINAGKQAAVLSHQYLKENHLQNSKEHIGKQTYYASDDFETFRENAKKMGIMIP